MKQVHLVLILTIFLIIVIGCINDDESSQMSSSDSSSSKEESSSLKYVSSEQKIGYQVFLTGWPSFCNESQNQNNCVETIIFENSNSALEFFDSNNIRINPNVNLEEMLQNIEFSNSLLVLQFVGHKTAAGGQIEVQNIEEKSNSINVVIEYDNSTANDGSECDPFILFVIKTSITDLLVEIVNK